MIFLKTAKCFIEQEQVEQTDLKEFSIQEKLAKATLYGKFKARVMDDKGARKRRNLPLYD